MNSVAIRPRLNSPAPKRSMGANVSKSPILDIIERLLIAAEHPDIVAVERYGPGDGPWGPDVPTSKAKAITGVKVKYQSTATASLWEAVWPGEQPMPAPAVMPLPTQNRAPRLAIFVARLLDVAQPEQFQAWRLVSLPGVGLPGDHGVLPFGLSIATAGGSKMLLRATATGPTVGFEPESEPFPDYVIPEEVKTCLSKQTQPAGAVSAERS